MGKDRYMLPNEFAFKPNSFHLKEIDFEKKTKGANLRNRLVWLHVAVTQRVSPLEYYPKMATSLDSMSSCGMPMPAFSKSSCLYSFILCEALPTSKRMICGLPSTSHRPQ